MIEEVNEFYEAIHLQDIEEILKNQAKYVIPENIITLIYKK